MTSTLGAASRIRVAAIGPSISARVRGSWRCCSGTAGARAGDSDCGSAVPIMTISASAIVLIRRFDREVARDHGAQHGAKVRGTLDTEAAFEAGLGVLPSLAAGEEALFARVGQMQILGAAVDRGWFDFDQAIALKRLNVAAERSPVHDHFLGQSVDGHWAEPFQLCQN